MYTGIQEEIPDVSYTQIYIYMLPEEGARENLELCKREIVNY